MNKEELLEVLLKTNKKKQNPVDDEILRDILSIVILNPLEENRGKSQEQIHYILSKKRVEVK